MTAAHRGRKKCIPEAAERPKNTQGRANVGSRRTEKNARAATDGRTNQRAQDSNKKQAPKGADLNEVVFINRDACFQASKLVESDQIQTSTHKTAATVGGIRAAGVERNTALEREDRVAVTRTATSRHERTGTDETGIGWSQRKTARN